MVRRVAVASADLLSRVCSFLLAKTGTIFLRFYVRFGSRSSFTRSLAACGATDKSSTASRTAFGSPDWAFGQDILSHQISSCCGSYFSFLLRMLLLVLQLLLLLVLTQRRF